MGARLRGVGIEFQEIKISNLLLALGAISETLSGVDIGLCAFDDKDRVLLWNRAFLDLFPEHARDIHAGEPYRANLRRFYEGRLDDMEMPFIERYIEEGVSRHRQQQRPFVFEHRGMFIKASSLPLPGVGRVRMWRRETGLLPGSPDAMVIAVGGQTTRPGNDSDVLSYLAEGLMLTDPDDRISWVNTAFLVMYGFPNVGEVMGTTFQEAYRKAWRSHVALDGSSFDIGMAVLTDNMRFVGAPFEVPLPDSRWARVTHQRRADGSGFSTHVDISVLKRQQEELRVAERQERTSKALLEATLERMQQGVMMVNADRVVEVCNRRAIELLGLPQSLMDSKPTFEEVLAYQWASDEFRRSSQTLQDFVRAGGILDKPQTYERQRPDGRFLEIQSVPIGGGGVLRTYTDITERRQSDERIRHIARHDGLTSLVNRDVFLESLAESLQRAMGDSDYRFAVHYVDLDGFKQINDEHGHAVGDKVLGIVAQRMRRIARELDVVARMGGDEFAILQPDTPDAGVATGLAQRVLASVREPLDIEGLRLRVGASIGIALFPGPARDVDSLLRNADRAMYTAKSAGRDCVHVFTG